MEYADPQLTGGHAPVKVLLFDLGGVLLRLNNPIRIFGLDWTLPHFRTQWLAAPAVRDFEAGLIDAETFARKVVRHIGLPYDWREFLRRFDAWPDRMFGGTLPLLQAIPASYRRALLSNINAAHWGRDEIEPALDGCFDHVFLSFATGLVKPDPASFAQVTDHYGCAAGEVLFFDDSQDNVDAAARFGMQAVHSDGIEAVATELRRRGILA